MRVGDASRLARAHACEIEPKGRGVWRIVGPFGVLGTITTPELRRTDKAGFATLLITPPINARRDAQRPGRVTMSDKYTVEAQGRQSFKDDLGPCPYEPPAPEHEWWWHGWRQEAEAYIAKAFAKADLI